MMMSVFGCGKKANDSETEEVISTAADATEYSEENLQEVTVTKAVDKTTDKSEAEITTEDSTDANEEAEEMTMEQPTTEITEETAKEVTNTPTPKATNTPTLKATNTPTPEATNTPTTGATKKTTNKAENTKQEEQKSTVTEAPEPNTVEYNPDTVVAKAIEKCKAGGMITTTDNLDNLLAEGKITQEEYNEYYPNDGLGYYSVFVETDLNKASTTSGRLLESVDGIVDYISGMMLLETDPIFNISYAGIYSYNGIDYYEFRCYR